MVPQSQAHSEVVTTRYERARLSLVAMKAQGGEPQKLARTGGPARWLAELRTTLCSKTAGPLVQLLSKGEQGVRLERELRDFLFAKARVLTSAGDLTTLYGLIPILAQVLVLPEEFDCAALTNPTSAVPAGLALVTRTLQLQFFSLALLGVSFSQLVVSTRENLVTKRLLFGRDPFCLDLWFPIGFNAGPGGARITFRRIDEPNAKPTGIQNVFELLRFAAMSGAQRRQLEFFFTYREDTAALSKETVDILVYGTTLPLIAIVAAVAPYLAYALVGVRDAQLGGTDLSELAELNLRLATSQITIAVIGVGTFVSAVIRASPEVRSEFSDEKQAGVLAAETIKLVGDVQMTEIPALLPSVLATALFLVFSIDGIGQAPAMEVTRGLCTAAQSFGTQTKAIRVATFSAAKTATITEIFPKEP